MHRFGVSFEQAAHRLSTLQRPGEAGIPFFFVRADIAGNVTKRFSAAGFHFSRYGGACPRLVVHEAFATPGLIRTPDRAAAGRRDLLLHRPHGGEGRRPLSRCPPRHMVVGMGCDIARGPGAGLCRRARPLARRWRDRDRHRLPAVRAHRLPPARLSAAAAPAGRRRDGEGPLGLCLPAVNPGPARSGKRGRDPVPPQRYLARDHLPGPGKHDIDLAGLAPVSLVKHGKNRIARALCAPRDDAYAAAGIASRDRGSDAPHGAAASAPVRQSGAHGGGDDPHRAARPAAPVFAAVSARTARRCNGSTRRTPRFRRMPW